MHTPRTTLEGNLALVDKIATYEDGWDGDGAKRFTDSDISAFREILQSLDVQPNHVDPVHQRDGCGDRSILRLEWANPGRGTVDYFVSGDGIEERSYLNGTSYERYCSSDECELFEFVEIIADTVDYLFDI